MTFIHFYTKFIANSGYITTPSIPNSISGTEVVFPIYAYTYYYSLVPLQAQIFTSNTVQFVSNTYNVIKASSSNRIITVSAGIADSYGVITSSSNITYSLASSYAGVSINSSSGVVTVTSIAATGSVQIVATYGSLSDTATLTIQAPIPQSMSFTSSTYSIVKRSSGSATTTVSASVLDIYGETMTGITIAYSINGTYTGVSINSSTGVISVSNTAAAGSVPIIATYGAITSNATLSIQPPIAQSVSFASSSYSLRQRGSGSVTTAVSAYVSDSYGDTMTGVSIVYSIIGTYAGVSINSSTGVITVSNTASTGSIPIRAAYGTITNNAVLTIQSPIAQSVSFGSSSYTVTQRSTGSVTTTVSASVFDSYGDIMTGVNVVYSINGTYAGVSINSSTGVITVSNTASAGSVPIKATYGTVSNTVNLIIQAPVAQTIIFGATYYTIAIPNSGNRTVTVTGSVLDSYGDIITGANLVFSLDGTYTGVSINSNTGVITVSSTAVTGTAHIIATYNSINNNVALNIEIPVISEIVFSSTSYTAKIPLLGTNTKADIYAIAKDTLGNVINDATILYSLAEPYSGVSIDSSTGVLTITCDAQEGTVNLKASSNGIIGTALLAIEKEVFNLALSVTNNNTYTLKLDIRNAESFNRTYTLVYDDRLITLTDLNASTRVKDIGELLGTDVTVTNLIPGEIRISINKDLEASRVWSGIINMFEFTAVGTGTTTISIE